MKRTSTTILVGLCLSCSLIAEVSPPGGGDADVNGDVDAEATGLVLTGGIATVSEAIVTEGELQMTEMGFEWGGRVCGTGPTGEEICVWGGIAP